MEPRIPAAFGGASAKEAYSIAERAIEIDRR